MRNKDLQALLSQFDDMAEVKIAILKNNVVKEVHSLEDLKASLSVFGLVLGFERE